MKTDKTLIEQALNTLKEQGKPLIIKELCKLTGYYYQQIYSAGYQSLAKKSARKQPLKVDNQTIPVAQNETDKLELLVIKTENLIGETIDWDFHMTGKNLNVYLKSPNKDDIEDAIEDLQFMLTKAIQKLEREKNKLK